MPLANSCVMVVRVHRHPTVLLDTFCLRRVNLAAVLLGLQNQTLDWRGGCRFIDNLRLDQTPAVCNAYRAGRFSPSSARASEKSISVAMLAGGDGWLRGGG